MEGPVLAPGGGGGGSEPLEWSFLQCFGERSPGEDIQEGAAPGTQLRPFNNYKHCDSWM